MPEPLFSCGDEIALEITPEDMPALQALLECSADYYNLIENHAPGPDAAISLVNDGPPGWGMENKILIGIFSQGGTLVAVLEGMRHYPRQNIFWIGLLLVDPSRRGQGLGERIMTGFEGWARSQGARQIRLGVVDVNKKALRFWQRIGFEQVGKKGSLYLGQQEHVVYGMKKKL